MIKRETEVITLEPFTNAENSILEILTAWSENKTKQLINQIRLFQVWLEWSVNNLTEHPNTQQRVIDDIIDKTILLEELAKIKLNKEMYIFSK
jgi:hypothetical protein